MGVVISSSFLRSSTSLPLIVSLLRIFYLEAYSHINAILSFEIEANLPCSCLPVHFMNATSFCSQSDNRVEAGGSHCWIEAEADADDGCHAECNEDREGTHDQRQSEGR